MRALLSVLIAGSALAADVDPVSPDVLAAAWARDEAARARYGHVPARLAPGDFARLAEGEAVVRRVHQEGADYGLGAIWMPAPPRAAWIALLDGHRPVGGEGVKVVHLPGSTDVRRFNYQLVDLPWPLSDRQWVSDVQANTPLWEATGGTTWERAWVAIAPSIAPEPDPEAVWMRTNEGGWLFSEAAGGTLVVFALRADVGGVVPDELSTAWALSTLEGALRRLAALAEEVPAHYRAGHTPVSGPDGRVLSAG